MAILGAKPTEIIGAELNLINKLKSAYTFLNPFPLPVALL
jgi:hypothetical protein